MKYFDIEHEVAAYFHKYQQIELHQMKMCGEGRISMSMSPAYWLSSDERTGGMSCDTYTYHIYKEREEILCKVEVKRLEAVCRENEHALEIEKIQWDTIQVMKPVPYGRNNPFEKIGEYPDLPLKGNASDKDYFAIRNLQNMFFEHRLHEMEKLFSVKEDTVLTAECLKMNAVCGKKKILESFAGWLEKEQKNNHCYLFLGITGMPLIEMTETGESAKGIFMTQIYQIKAGLLGSDVDNWRLVRTMEVTETEYCREAGEWKIHKMKIQNLASLPETPYRNDGRYDKSGMSDEPWDVNQVMRCQPDTETAMEIENIINRWVYGCRRGALREFIEKYMKNSEQKNHMLIRSFGKTTPKLNDYEAIERKIDDMTQQYRERFFTFHAPTTPVLTYDPKKKYILGTWFDTAATNLRSMAESLEDIPYMVFVNKYVHKFEKIDGHWYLTDFYCEPIISLQDWRFDMVHSKGYINASKTGKYPKRFELQGEK